MRVNVQLIEAETGAHLWAERFDKPIADLFEMQTRSSPDSRTSFTPNLLPPRRAAPSRTLAPIRWISSFKGTLNRGLSADLLAKARGFFARAVELDPANIDALIGAAVADARIAWSFQTDDPRP